MLLKMMFLKPASLGKDTLDSRWDIGHCLGLQDDSAELIIGASSGVLKVRSVRPYVSSADQWNGSSLKTVVGLPWASVPGRDGIEIKSSVKFQAETGEDMKQDADHQSRPYIAKAMKFLKEHSKIRGYARSPRLQRSQSECSSSEPLRCVSNPH